MNRTCIIIIKKERRRNVFKCNKPLKHKLMYNVPAYTRIATSLYDFDWYDSHTNLIIIMWLILVGSLLFYLIFHVHVICVHIF